MSTTPFELRYSIYESALDRLKEKYFSDMETYKTRTDNTFDTDLNLSPPVFPSVEDAIREAEQIYRFVQTK
ncbi:MAG TPA: hypothetical protein DF712_09140 [Balneola sp.]|nr:hypothetical protein [Balneola sp.]|tara:strand:+ start:554 stop:766 length:213 start_codon:yes stop_codon:yes gene_type:complete